MTTEGKEKQYDPEWTTLIREAKELGLTLEEVRNFFETFQRRSVF